MQPRDLIVRCMIRKEGTLWVASCIDLCLAAQGYTIQEAKSALHKQIYAYVREALTVDSEHANVLLTRKAPWVDVLRFHLMALQIKLSQGWVTLKSKKIYTDSLPLAPAS